MVNTIFITIAVISLFPMRFKQEIYIQLSSDRLHVAISVSPHACFILVLILISMFLR